MSDNVWVVFLTGKWDCKWHWLTLCACTLDVIALVYWWYACRCVSCGVMSVVSERRWQTSLTLSSFLTLSLERFASSNNNIFIPWRHPWRSSPEAPLLPVLSVCLSHYNQCTQHSWSQHRKAEQLVSVAPSLPASDSLFSNYSSSCFLSCPGL